MCWNERKEITDLQIKSGKQDTLITRKEVKTMGFEDADAWINLSKSGKGILVKIDGVLYATSLKSVENVLSGEKKGAKLSKLVGDKTEEA